MTVIMLTSVFYLSCDGHRAVCIVKVCVVSIDCRYSLPQNVSIDNTRVDS